MPTTRYSTEQMVSKLRQAEVELSRGLRTPAVCKKLGGQRANFLPVAEGVWGPAARPGQAAQGARAGEHAAEEAGGRPSARQHDPQRGGLGTLLSPPRRRQAVAVVRHQLGVSERRACRVLGQARSTHRHRGRTADDEPRLVARIIELATQYGRYGYRRITGLLRGEGWPVNHKRVERLWRRERLKVPQKQPKRGRLWLTDGSCIRRRPAYRHHVWAYDFLTARTPDGRVLKILVVVDEYSRECLAIVVARRRRSLEVLETLADLFVAHGVPAHMRSACYEQVVKALGAVGSSNRGTDTGSGSVEPAHRASSGLIPEERRVPGGSTSSCLRREELRTTVGMASSPVGAGASGFYAAIDSSLHTWSASNAVRFLTTANA